MAARGDLFGEGPGACPFVALDNDRDKRSDMPDYRHRCYAEPTPQPRALAHQEAFCLSPSFPTCPIFRDWAARAAARPVPSGYQGSDLASSAAAGVLEAEVLDSGSAPEVVEPVPEPPPPVVEPPAPVVEPELAQEQLGAFDSTAEPTAEPDAEPPYEPYTDEEVPDVPPFLAERPPPAAAAAVAAASATPQQAAPRASIQREPSLDPVRREDVVPSWEIDGRFGAQPPAKPPDTGSGSNLLTAIAVIAILALGVAGVIFLPGLLAGSPAQTTRPSFSALPSPSGTPAPTASLASPTPALTPTPAEPTDTPEPTPTPRLYRIKAGDTLARIARRNDITVADIIAANPEITDPNDIFVGQLIIIPRPLPTA